MQRRNCLPFDAPKLGELAVIGTDASDFACGELVWLDGMREEVNIHTLRLCVDGGTGWQAMRGLVVCFE